MFSAHTTWYTKDREKRLSLFGKAYGDCTMFVGIEKRKLQTLPRLIRSIHPLCWLLLLCLISSWAVSLYGLTTYGPPRGEVSDVVITSLLITGLIAVVHIGIYEVAFRLTLSRHMQWLLLATQAILALVLIQLSQDPQVMVA